MPTPLPAGLATRLDQARKDLLDLGLRNSLLNYKAPKSRGVEVVGTTSIDVLASLVSERKSLPFLSDGAMMGASGGLPTRIEDGPLKRRLLSTLLTAKAHIEERGANILFLALGMLHWFEDEASTKELRAPLLLVPVELERISARDRFTLKVSDEDIEGNLSLVTKLRNDFGLTLPPLPDVEDLDLANWFERVATAVESQRRWKVAPDEISLGFFSFGKFLMYRDLAPEVWQLTHGSSKAPVLLTGLLGEGFATDPSPVAEDEYLDQLVAPDALAQVVDMDSSQALALLDIRAGRHLVIQGPPGTGKSQTITNVIADAVSQGKRVLFVAEKMAALEVVKRRLDKVHVGDACLELHSHTATKKALLHELKRTMHLGKPQAFGAPFDLSRYTQLRDQLTDYCKAVNDPVGESDFTPHQLMGELVATRAQLGATPLPRFEAAAEPRKLLSRGDLGRLITPVAALQRHLGAMGVPARHPFRASRLQTLLPTERQELAATLSDYLATCQTLVSASKALASFMGLEAKADEADTKILANAARRALTAPHLKEVKVDTDDWQRQRDSIRGLLITGKSLSELRAQFDQQVIPEAWDIDLLHERHVLRGVGRKWWRVLSSDYRRARNKVAGLCANVAVRDVDGQLRIVETVLQARRLSRTFAESESLGARLFGVQWQGKASDWAVLDRINEWVVALYRDIGQGAVPPGIVSFLAGNPALQPLGEHVNAVDSALAAHGTVVPAVVAGLKLGDGTSQALRAASFDQQAAQAQVWITNIDRLPEWMRYLHLYEALQSAGAGWLLPLAHTWEHSAAHLAAVFRHRALEDLLSIAFRDRAPLRSFNTSTQEEVRETFAAMDRACFGASQLSIASAHWRSLPRGGGHGQIGVLRREFEKRSRHMPIRKLMRDAGNAIQAIKPVFMMSPMSIASFLPPRTIEFDLVVFDEASQVKPVDAFGAVMRANQLVVVGDSKQLPPTSFFETLASDSEAGDEDDDAPPSADIESILGLAAGQGVSQRMLRWHYRSRHESLIALSNKEFYDHRLVVFPSPDATRSGLGLVYHHLPETTYDRGRSRTNRKEAAAVARAVMAHARERPSLSLGVAAFSMAQADAVIDELERMRQADPACEPFFAAHPFEPFFVKNLESVQGDERDVIFISVGYGKDESGYLAMGFGALNGDGGERRLNVLITRARLSCEVFSNLTHDDLDLRRTPSRGVASLKAFLKYAATGILDLPDTGRTEHDSVFEEQVALALTQAGQRVVSQVGSGGFRIDLAVVDPHNAGRYLVGIECDGASYHSSRSARDRDRLREQVLMDLGWKIHRIWSTDWFTDPDKELKRALQAISQASVWEPSRGKEPPTLADPGLLRVDEGQHPTSPTTARPYIVASVTLALGDNELYEVPIGRLADLVEQVVAAEGPVHVREIMRRIADGAGVKRIGSRIEAALRKAIDRAVEHRNGLLLEGEFVRQESVVVMPRNRSALPPASRRVECIAPSEFEAAVLEVATSSFGIHETDLPAAVARALGISRTEEVVNAVTRAVHASTRQGVVHREQGQVRVVG
jgi:very-short-patch-repair endonuclease